MPAETPEIPPVRNGSGWVVVSHPGIDGFAEVTEQAYDLLYEDKGWVAYGPAASLAGMNKADLVAEAGRVGLDTTGTADELRERIRIYREGGGV